MEYIKGFEFKLHNTAVTLGKFDGIHLGHRELIDIVLNTKKLKKVLFTFDINPLSIFFGKELRIIDTTEERKLLLKNSGIDYVIDYPFTRETINTDADTFIREVIIDKLDAKKIVVGDDFKFGKDRQGDVNLLQKMSKVYKYKLVVVKKLVIDGAEVSSTRIRNLIKTGDVREAGTLLGRPFSVMGEIVHGNHLGHTVGMPTINLIPASNKLLPPFGVYTSDTELDGKIYRGVTNIGIKPTVGSTVPGVETWLFDLNRDVYGHFAKVKLLDFIRPEVKFNSLEELKKQVNLDALRSLSFKG